MARRLKIGFILDDSLDKADGVQQYVLTMGEWLRSQGHNVHYLVSTTRRTDIANIHSLGKNIGVRFNGNRMSMPLPSSKSAIKKLLARERFDVLHVQMPHSPWLAQRVIVAADSATAIVGTFHIAPIGGHVQAASSVLAAWLRPSLKRIDAVVSVSTAAQDFARQAFRIKSTVLPNVIDYLRFFEAKPFNEYEDKLNIVFLGRLVPRKGCITLLQAVNELAEHEDVPSHRVLICGRGPLEAELKAYVMKHDLRTEVVFTGFVEEADKARYLQSADIAVFPSRGGESFGIVLIEAMAAGAAVLAGDNPGYRSVMQPKEELLFKPQDAIELAQKLRRLLSDDAARKGLQAWGQAYAKQFDTGVVGAQLIDLYEEALRKRRDVR